MIYNIGHLFGVLAGEYVLAAGFESDQNQLVEFGGVEEKLAKVVASKPAPETEEAARAADSYEKCRAGVNPHGFDVFERDGFFLEQARDIQVVVVGFYKKRAIKDRAQH